MTEQLPSQDDILKAMVKHTTETLTQQQKDQLVRIFANFQRNYVPNTETKKLDEPNKGA